MCGAPGSKARAAPPRHSPRTRIFPDLNVYSTDCNYLAMGSLVKLLGIAVAALVGLAACLPTDFTAIRVDLSKVLNQTVCPIRVEYDVDPKRIPQRIKVLKCGADPLQWCRRLGVPAQECCHRQRDDAWMGCTEVLDSVEVYYPERDVSQPYRVAVGCACVIEEVQAVGELTPADFRN